MNVQLNIKQILATPVRTLQNCVTLCEVFKYFIVNLADHPDHPVRRMITEGLRVLERIPYTREEFQ